MRSCATRSRQLERPGAGQVGRHVATQRLGRDHHAGAIRQHGDQRRVGLRQMQPHRVRIDDFHRRHRLQLALAQAFRCTAVALQVGLHRIGGHRLAVVELHAVAQRHGQRQVVRRPRPRRGKLRYEIVLRVDVDQLVAHRGEYHAADEAAAAGRVQRVGILVESDAQRRRRRRTGQMISPRQAAATRRMMASMIDGPMLPQRGVPGQRSPCQAPLIKSGQIAHPGDCRERTLSARARHRTSGPQHGNGK